MHKIDIIYTTITNLPCQAVYFLLTVLIPPLSGNVPQCVIYVVYLPNAKIFYWPREELCHLMH